MGSGNETTACKSGQKEKKENSEMAGWKELCLHRDVERLVFAHAQRCGLAEKMLRGAQREAVSRRHEVAGAGHVEEVARQYIKTAGLEVQLKNLIYQEVLKLHSRQHTLPLLPPSLLCKEPLPFLRVAQEDWEERVKREINTLCREVGEKIARERTLTEQQWIRNKWNGIGSDFPIPSSLRHISSSKDLLDVILSVHSPNTVWNGDSADMECGLMQFQLGSKSLYDLREEYASLRECPQIEEVVRELDGDSSYIQTTTKVISMGLHPLAREACRRGCPVTHRCKLWGLALGVELEGTESTFHFEKLKSSFFHTKLFLEKLVVKDVREGAGSDDNYFVFEDTIMQVLLAFLHDYSVLDDLLYINMTPIRASIEGCMEGEQVEVVYPPCGIVPFQGLSSFVAPLCYILDQADQLYSLFRQIYLRFFIHLHNISSHRQGIVGLCCLFESLLLSRQPKLFHHLNQIQAHPLHLVYGWLSTAFSSQLICAEVLLLWDRIIGYDSMDVLAVLAVGVLEFRAENLFNAKSLEEAQEILSDLRSLKILPLLQQTLFL